MTVCFCFCYSSSYPQQMILEILINVTFCTLYICYFYAYALWAFKHVQNLFMPEKLSMIDWWQILLTLQLILHLCSHTSPLNEAAQMDSGDESSVTTPESWKCPFHYFKSVYCCVIQWLVTSDGSDGTQNDPGHPDNEWGWLSRRLGGPQGLK